jgi:hypothetical protein
MSDPNIPPTDEERQAQFDQNLSDRGVSLTRLASDQAKDRLRAIRDEAITQIANSTPGTINYQQAQHLRDLAKFSLEVSKFLSDEYQEEPPDPNPAQNVPPDIRTQTNVFLNDPTHTPNQTDDYVRLLGTQYLRGWL